MQDKIHVYRQTRTYKKQGLIYLSESTKTYKNKVHLSKWMQRELMSHWMRIRRVKKLPARSSRDARDKRPKLLPQQQVPHLQPLTLNLHL